jgi:hypothetical protein
LVRPHFIEMVVEPSALICGEMAQVLAKVTDALGQNVMDESEVEFVTNQGGTLTPPLAKTFNGVRDEDP